MDPRKLNDLKRTTLSLECKENNQLVKSLKYKTVIQT